MTALDRARSAFRERFGDVPPGLARAPGRVNLLGDHTDYNDGYVLPMAVDRDVAIAFRHRTDDRVVVHSEAFEAPAEFGIGANGERLQGWGTFVQGVAWALAEAGHPLRGWEGVVASDVPVGSGLSSSAALEMALARVFTAGSTWDGPAMARLGRTVENEWLGLGSGIMDQFVIATAEQGHAMLLDCRTLRTSPVPVPEAVTVVVLDTGVPRELVRSPFDERRRECRQAAAVLGVDSLRDTDEDAVTAAADRLGDVLLRRARHVITENARVLATADAMHAADLAVVGELMWRSHASLRDDYQASSAELDAMVEIALSHDGCHGARMTGAGWGGCAVALVASPAVEAFVARVPASYAHRTGRAAKVYPCTAAAGVSLAAA